MSKNKGTEKTDNELINDNAAQQQQPLDDQNENNATDNMSADEQPNDSQTEKMSEELSEWRDKYVRLSAEFDNYRKRTLKEKMELVSTASEDVIKSLLPVLDDLDRALQAMNSATDVAAVREGVVLISNKLCETLRNKGLVEIDAMQKEFDTDYHEAITKIPAPDDNLKGHVVDVVQKGYMLKDKVIRHSKVVVGE